MMMSSLEPAKVVDDEEEVEEETVDDEDDCWNKLQTPLTSGWRDRHGP